MPSLPLPAALLLSLTTLGTVEVSAKEIWFPWPQVAPAPGSALDASDLSPEPAGSHGFVRVQNGHFATGDGKPLRFWGANLAAAQAFPPDVATAETTARVLSAAGLNIVRLHHMDNTWGLEDRTSIWPKGAKKHDELAPEQLDKVHRLIAALKARGIYSNINLKVSKALVEADGFPASVTKIPEFQKRIDFFDRRMIDLQKDYAKRLLTPVNPYTKLSPIDDPAVAVIEINNENSLLGYWTKNLGHGFDKFPVEFRAELTALWNRWLKQHYADDHTLKNAWNPVAGTPKPDLLSPKDGWPLSAGPGCKASVEQGGDNQKGFVLQIEKTDGLDWHVQSSHRKLHLTDGESYTVEFEVRSDDIESFQVLLGLDTELHPDQAWRELGFRDVVKPTSQWTLFRRSFIATSAEGVNGRLDFNLGQKAGNVVVRNLRLYAGSPVAGLLAGQSPRDGSVPIPEAPSRRQWEDWITFLADTERAFADEMRDYLRKELHVKVPIVCSQIDYGGLAGVWREQGSDFADGHAYWQHPDFGASVDWDASRWTIKNSPQISELQDRNFQQLGALALYRISGKPYTISEYDHPAPSEYTSEMYPTIASFAAVQDWDGIYLFDTGPFGSNDKDGRITAYFDNQHNPSKWAQSVFAARLFREFRVPAASASARLDLPTPFWSEAHHADILWNRLLPTGSFGFLQTRYEVSDRSEPGKKTASLARSGSLSTTPLELLKTETGVVYRIDTPNAAALVGFLGKSVHQTSLLTIDAGAFGKNFASLTASSRDGKPLNAAGDVLVTLVGRSENTGMIWNERRTSVGNQWGHGPVLAEFIPATITLKVDGPRRVFALSPDGTRHHEVPSTLINGVLRFATDPSRPTLHFEVVHR